MRRASLRRTQDDRRSSLSRESRSRRAIHLRIADARFSPVHRESRCPIVGLRRKGGDGAHRVCSNSGEPRAVACQAIAQGGPRNSCSRSSSTSCSAANRRRAVVAQFAMIAPLASPHGARRAKNRNTSPSKACMASAEGASAAFALRRPSRIPRASTTCERRKGSRKLARAHLRAMHGSPPTIRAAALMCRCAPVRHRVIPLIVGILLPDVGSRRIGKTSPRAGCSLSPPSPMRSTDTLLGATVRSASSGNFSTRWRIS